MIPAATISWNCSTFHFTHFIIVLNVVKFELAVRLRVNWLFQTCSKAKGRKSGGLVQLCKETMFNAGRGYIRNDADHSVNSMSFRGI